jgi:hypothetical protein
MCQELKQRRHTTRIYLYRHDRYTEIYRDSAYPKFIRTRTSYFHITILCRRRVLKFKGLHPNVNMNPTRIYPMHFIFSEALSYDGIAHSIDIRSPGQWWYGNLPMPIYLMSWERPKKQRIFQTSWYLFPKRFINTSTLANNMQVRFLT